MSQWGARGLAEQGKTSTQILNHYYSGTTVSSASVINDLRVLIAEKSGSAQLAAFGNVTVKHGATTLGTTSGYFTVSRSGNNVALSGPINATKSSITITLSAPVHVSTTGHSYARGKLHIKADPAGGLRMTVIELSMDNYLRGLGEMPALWHSEALKAQAIAGRTYAQKIVSGSSRSGDFDLYAGVIHQSYNGFDIENGYAGDRWITAVTSSSGKVVKHGSSLIDAVYSASSGGYTENSEYVWVSSLPFLRGKSDPADRIAANPHNSWSATFSGTTLGQKLGMGPVVRVDTSGPIGVSSRLDKATLTFHSSTGTKQFTGAQVRSKLGLKSTKFSVNSGSGSSSGPPSGSISTIHVWDQNMTKAVVAGKASDPDGAPRVIVAHQGPKGIRLSETQAVGGNFLTTVDVTPGAHKICVSVLDKPTNAATSLGCRDIVK